MVLRLLACYLGWMDYLYVIICGSKRVLLSLIIKGGRWSGEKVEVGEGFDTQNTYLDELQ